MRHASSVNGARKPVPDATVSGTLPPLLRDERGLYLPVPEGNFLQRWVETPDLTAAELDELVELFRRAFNGGASWFHYGVAPIEHLRWKTVDGPYRSRTTLQETLDGGDGKPIGASLAQYQRYVVDGQERAVLQGSDAALDPSAQGRGIHSSLNRLSDVTNQADRDVGLRVRWGVGHPIWNHLTAVKPMSNDLVLANRVVTYAKPLTWSGLRRRCPSRPEQAGVSRTRDELRGYRRTVGVKQISRLLVAQLRAAVHRVRVPGGVRGEWRIETVGEFGPEVDVFWAQAATQFDFVQIRDREYLNWRYRDRRAGPFEVRVAISGDQMLGFAAIRADQREAVLADLLALPERVDVAEALLDDAIAVARRAGSPTMRLWLQQSHPYAKAVRQRGFFDTDQRLRMLIRRMWADSPVLPFADDPNARVHAMLGDSDHV